MDGGKEGIMVKKCIRWLLCVFMYVLNYLSFLFFCLYAYPGWFARRRDDCSYTVK